MQLVSWAGRILLGVQPMWIHMGWRGMEIDRLKDDRFNIPNTNYTAAHWRAKNAPCADEVTAKVSILTS